jgi:hypothetical protein
MSTYEKIASVLLTLLLVGGIIASYREIKEPEPARGPETSDFDASRGQDFKLGPYSTIVDEHTSGGQESNCTALQPEVIGALHDIKQRLDAGGDFEVNQPVLQLLCNKNAQITLSDAGGNRLILQKVPFTRVVPQGGTAADIGTKVHLDATVVPKGAAVPAQPTTFGEVLIPDRFLDTATSSAV